MQEGWGCIGNLSTPPNSIYRLFRASICPLAWDSPRCREPYGQRHTPPSGRIKPILPIHFSSVDERRGQRLVMMPVLLPLKWPYQHVKADLMRAHSCWSPNCRLKVGGWDFTSKSLIGGGRGTGGLRWLQGGFPHAGGRRSPSHLSSLGVEIMDFN